MRISRLTAVLAAAVAIGLASAASLTGPAAAETVIHRGNGTEPETLDPHKSTGVPEAWIQYDLFEGLVYPSAKAEITPGVAEKWDVSDDGLTVTFHLRSDAKWSDGSPVTAEDFVYSWRRLVDPETASDYAYFLWPVKNAKDITDGKAKPEEMGVAAPDARTFVVTLEQPTPYFVGSLMHTSTWPVKKDAVEKLGQEWTKPGNFVGNGPYTLAEWVPQSHLKLVKNPNFHDAASATIDTVFYYPTEDVDQELKRYRAGELDITYDAPGQMIPWIEENMKDEFHNVPYLGTYFYAFNTTTPPFDQLALRQALTMAIDRETIVSKISQGGELPAYGWVPPGFEGYTQQQFSWAGMSPEKRVEEAKKLFAEAGFGPSNPLETEILYNTSENHKKIAIAVAGMWQQVFGKDAIKVSLRNEEWKVYLETRDQLQFQVVRAGWIGDYKDPYTFAGYLRSDIGEQNPAGYKSAKYDELMTQSEVERDARKRMQLMEEGENILLADVPIMPIYFYTNQNIVSKRVAGWEDNIMGWHPSRYLTVTR